MEEVGIRDTGYIALERLFFSVRLEESDSNFSAKSCLHPLVMKSVRFCECLKSKYV